MSGRHGLAIDAAAWASPWRRRRVRDKAVLSLGLVACAITMPWQVGVAAGAIALTVMLGPARVPADLLFRSLRAPLVFVLIGAATIAVSIGGTGGVTSRFFAVTPDSLSMAGHALVRGTAGFLSVFVLAATTPMVDVLASMRRLRIPDALLDIAGVTYRLLFVFMESVHAITAAQTARLGYATRRAAMRSAAGAIGAVLVRAWSRSSRLEAGLAGRGFEDALVTLDPPREGSARFLAASVAVLVALVAAGITVWWLGGDTGAGAFRW